MVAEDVLARARMLADLGRDEEAEPLLAELYRRAPESQLQPIYVAVFVSRYGICLAKLEKWEVAEKPLREAHERLGETTPVNLRTKLEVVASLAAVCTATNRADEAVRWDSEAAALRAQISSATSSTRPATLPAR